MLPTTENLIRIMLQFQQGAQEVGEQKNKYETSERYYWHLVLSKPGALIITDYIVKWWRTNDERQESFSEKIMVI